MVFFFFLAFFISLLFSCPSYAMLISSQTVVSPDKSRYITLLGHHHRQTGWNHEGRQIDELIAICKEGVKEGKKFHILYEKIGIMARFFLPERSMLGDIEQDFAKADVPNCTFESIEIRIVGSTARQIFDLEGRVKNPKMVCDENYKPLDEFTFQDLFDEFEKYADDLGPFALKTVNDHPECPNVCLIHFKYTDACEQIDRIKQYLQKCGLKNTTKILALALNHQDDCKGLEWATQYAFDNLLELHILHRLLQLDPDVQPIVIAGAWHTQMVYQSLDDLRWQARLYESDIFAESPKPLEYQTIRSFVLNETAWDRTTKKVFTYWASIQAALSSQFQTVRKSILSSYC